MANRWGNSGNSDRLFFSFGLKITGDADCRHEVKRWLLLGRKAMINLGSILKSRDISLLTEICIVKAMVFPVVMYGCESWIIKKAECWRIDAFWTMVLEKTRESLGLQGAQTSPSQGLKSVLNIHWKDRCWSWSSNSLATWCEELTQKRHWCWERFKAGELDRGWDGWMASPTLWAWVWASSGSGDGQGGLVCCSPCGHRQLDTTGMD